MEERALHALPEGVLLHDRYIVNEILGEGGFGITYAGYDKVLDFKVAIKEFYPHGFVTRNSAYSQALTVNRTRYGEYFQKEKKKFLNEARTLARFNQEEGIVSVIDFFEDNNTAYIVMEYLDGINLKDYIMLNGPLTVLEILDIMSPLIRILNVVHKSGLIHRDISPDNIMMLTGNRVKLMDFGAARAFGDSGEKSKSVVLKYGYAPEEQYRSMGIQGPWTDVYALCATIYKCITGITPVEAVERLQGDTLMWPSQMGVAIPPDIERALMKGLSVLREHRYQNMAELYMDLYSRSIEDYAFSGSEASYDWEDPSAREQGGRSYQDPSTSGSRVESPGYQWYPDKQGTREEYTGTSSANNDSGMNILIAVMITITVMLAIGGIILGIYLKDKKSSLSGEGTVPGTEKSETVTEASTSADTEESEEKATESESTVVAATTETERQEDTGSLDYTSNTYVDIQKCLTPASYEVTYSPDGEFSFGYPKYMFNQSSFDASENSYWLAYSSDGYDYPYELYVYEEDNPGDPLTRATEEYEYYKNDFYSPPADFKPKMNEEAGMARGSLGGPLDSYGDKCAYMIFANNGVKNYILKFYYTGDPDVNYEYDDIDYVVDCIYRYCSFSSTTYKPRTHQQFLKDDMGEKK